MHSTNVPLFASMYSFRTRWNAMMWGSSFFRYIFSGKITSNLPLTGNLKGILVTSDCGKCSIRLYLLPIYPKNEIKKAFGRRRGTSKHRVFVICPMCGKRVWAGRINQHKCPSGI